MEFKQFILEHEADDPVKLALSRDRYAAEVEDFDLVLNTLEARRKLRNKVPEWYALPQLRYPFKLSTEQCSSSETARYKAQVALAVVQVQNRPNPHLEGGEMAIPGAIKAQTAPGPGPGSLLKCKSGPKCTWRLADLTGGLGVDSWAFAQFAEEVLYNEMKPELADATRYNLAELGVRNVRVQSRELQPGNLQEVLGDFQPDVIFLDPARRASDGRKVFRLEDCQPDLLRLLPELLEACPLVLAKLSPMADITLVCKQLHHVKQVHVVAAEGECKELLLLLEKGWEGPYALYVYDSGAVMEIPGQAGNDICPAERSAGIPTWLFEPGKALLKAGAFDLPCRYGLSKMGQHTHLYVCSEPVPEVLRPFGKVFEILEMIPLNNRNIKDIGKRYPAAEVTARNIPISSEELRKKLGVRSGGSVHIFGCTEGKERLLLVAAI